MTIQHYNDVVDALHPRAKRNLCPPNPKCQSWCFNPAPAHFKVREWKGPQKIQAAIPVRTRIYAPPHPKFQEIATFDYRSALTASLRISCRRSCGSSQKWGRVARKLRKSRKFQKWVAWKLRKLQKCENWGGGQKLQSCGSSRTWLRKLWKLPKFGEVEVAEVAEVTWVADFRHSDFECQGRSEQAAGIPDLLKLIGIYWNLDIFQ